MADQTAVDPLDQFEDEEMSPFSPPDSPPVGPVIPEGLTTKLSKAAIALLTLYTLITVFLNGDHSTETITGIAGAVAVLLGLTGSRGYQAGQALRDAPSPRQAALLPLVGEVVSTSVSRFAPGDDEPEEDDVDPALAGLGLDEFDQPVDFDPAHEQRDIHEIDEKLARGTQ